MLQCFELTTITNCYITTDSKFYCRRLACHQQTLDFRFCWLSFLYLYAPCISSRFTLKFTIIWVGGWCLLSPIRTGRGFVFEIMDTCLKMIEHCKLEKDSRETSNTKRPWKKNDLKPFAEATWEGKNWLYRWTRWTVSPPGTFGDSMSWFSVGTLRNIGSLTEEKWLKRLNQIETVPNPISYLVNDSECILTGHLLKVIKSRWGSCIRGCSARSCLCRVLSTAKVFNRASAVFLVCFLEV